MGSGAFKKRASESSVGAVFYSRAWRLFKIGFPSWTSRPALYLYGVAFVSMVVSLVLSTLVSSVVKPLQDTTLQAEYGKTLLLVAGISMALSVCALLYTLQIYAGERMRLRWRQAVVTRIHQAYFRSRLLYAGAYSPTCPGVPSPHLRPRHHPPCIHPPSPRQPTSWTRA